MGAREWDEERKCGGTRLLGEWSAEVYACSLDGTPYVRVQLVRYIDRPGHAPRVIPGRQEVVIPAAKVESIVQSMQIAAARASRMQGVDRERWPIVGGHPGDGAGEVTGG